MFPRDRLTGAWSPGLATARSAGRSGARRSCCPVRHQQARRYHPQVPTNAVLLLAFFTLAAILVGVLLAWVVGPRRWWAALVPSAAGFLALWAVGHRSGLALGPTVILFGFEVNLLFDLGVATLAAAIAAVAQCLVLGRLGRSGAG